MCRTKYCTKCCIAHTAAAVVIPLQYVVRSITMYYRMGCIVCNVFSMPRVLQFVVLRITCRNAPEQSFTVQLERSLCVDWSVKRLCLAADEGWLVRLGGNYSEVRGETMLYGVDSPMDSPRDAIHPPWHEWLERRPQDVSYPTPGSSL